MRKKLLTLLLTISVFATSAVLFVNKGTLASNEPILGDTGFAGQYAVGSVVDVQKADVTVNGKTFSVQPAIISPSGARQQSTRVILSELGKYTAEYTAIDGANTYAAYANFVVYNKLGSTSDKNDTSSFGSFPGLNKQGLKVNLSQGSIFTYNKLVDFSNKTVNDVFFDAVITPAQTGAVEAIWMYVKLTDAFDPTNYILISLRQSPDTVNLQKITYIRAGVGKQDRIGYSSGMDSTGTQRYSSGNYGFTISNSFTGSYYNDAAYGITLSLDNQTGMLYAENQYYSAGNNKIVNLKNPADFSEPWKGFTQNRAILEVYADTYSRGSFGFIINGIYDHDLAPELSEVTQAPDVVVDFENYAENSVPTAVVGSSYKVFDASINSVYGLETLSTKVYYAYTSNNKRLMKTTDGRFTPDRAGLYTIEYVCTDRFGNESKETINVNAVLANTAFPIELEILTNNVALSGYQGALLTVSSDWNIDSDARFGTVAITTRAYLKSDPSVVAQISNNSFRPTKAGVWVVEYIALNHAGQTATSTYEVEITVSNAPIFTVESVVLPKYLIAGGRYVLPTVTTVDYTDGAKTIVAKAYERVGEGTKLISDTSNYVPTIAQGTVSIFYEATSSLGNKAELEAGSVPVINVNALNGDIDPTKYFNILSGQATTSIVGTGSYRYASFSTNGALKMEFINALSAEGLSFAFNLAKNPGANKVNVYLVDSQNQTQGVKVSFINENGSLAVSINGNSPIAVANYNFAGGGSLIRNIVEYSNSKLNICSTLNITVENYWDMANSQKGGAFKGFTSGNIYLGVELEYPTANTAETKLELIYINNQVLYAISDDIAPSIIFGTDALGGQYTPGTSLTLNPVGVSDVFNPYSYITLTVRDGSGNTISAIDGTLLNNVDATKSYKLKLDAISKYLIIYTAVDGQGNERTLTKGLEIIDNEPAVITLSKTSATATVGAKVTLPTAQATDNIAKNLVIYKYLVTPSGAYTPITADNFTPTTTGKYIVRHITFDGVSMTVADFTVRVS